MVGRGCLCSGCRARWPRWTLFTHAICATVPLHSPTLKKRSVTATTPTRTRTHAHTHTLVDIASMRPRPWPSTHATVLFSRSDSQFGPQRRRYHLGPRRVQEPVAFLPRSYGCVAACMCMRVGGGGS
jgi:hypothetical protein